MRSIVEPSLRPGVRAPLACNIAAMRDIANGFRPEELSKNAFRLYEKFRPAIPEGVTGWRCCILDHTLHKRFSRRVALFLSAYHFLGTTRLLQYHRSTLAAFSVTSWGFDFWFPFWF
jgi:hypothetical protein